MKPAAGAGAGLALPLGEQAAATFARACESGLAHADDSVLFGAPPVGADAADLQA